MPIRIDHDRKTATRETDHGPLAIAYDQALEALWLGRAYELWLSLPTPPPGGFLRSMPWAEQSQPLR